MASYGAKGGDGSYAYMEFGLVNHAQPVCGEMTYIVGVIQCLTCCTSNPIKSRQGRTLEEYKFTCRTCRTKNVYGKIIFGSNN